MKARSILILLCCSVINVFSQTFPYKDPSKPIEERVADLLARMTIEEKLGQMMQVDLSVVRSHPELLIQYNIGSVLSGGGSAPLAGTLPAHWADMYDTLQTYALQTRLQVPIIYGIDAVHGHNNVYGATIFPHNIGMGCTRNPALMQQAARVTATEMAATGVDWTFAPCIAVPRNERWGRTYEGFGETPELAQLFGAAAVRGFQAETLAAPTSVLACAKHFLGDGGTTDGIDRGNTVLPENQVRQIHLPGYVSAVEAGVGSIMVSFNSINGTNMHGSHYWITDVLKNELGYKGFVVSDWGGVDLLTANYKDALEQAINAGIDMVMQARYTVFIDLMKELLAEGRIDTARIDDAVRRILTAKFKLGLFERPFADRTFLPTVGSPEHRIIARQCVRESVVLLKKKDGILPLPKNAHLYVAGVHAHNIGLQCGGWTISWQGSSGTITEGTTLLQGLREVAPAAHIEYSATGDFSNGLPDYSIVVLGENPYAEYFGDRRELTLSEALVKKMKNYGAPVVVILLTGRPMILEKLLHFSDVIIAAWLPGTEGGGIADILFGDCEPKGLLSHSWPKSMAQIPLNVEDVLYDPLYAYGYGIQSFANSPVGSSPVYLSGIVQPDGKHLEITFNKAMADPSAVAASFVITRNGTTIEATVHCALKPDDSTTIVLEMDSSYFTSRFDMCTLAYTGGILQSADGGMLQPFTPQNIVVWTTPKSKVLPAHIEAEECSDMYGVECEPSNDVDNTFAVVNIDEGDYVEYPITVPANGSYYVSLRIANPTPGGQVLLSCSGKNITKSLPPTGSNTLWKTSTSTQITLSEGEQLLRIRALTGGFKLNWIFIGTTPSSVGGEEDTPHRFKLEQNYPNPANPTTCIQYTIPSVAQKANVVMVTLKLYDVLGREVATLVNTLQEAGTHSLTFNATNLPSGVYFYKLYCEGVSVTRKMLVLK